MDCHQELIESLSAVVAVQGFLGSWERGGGREGERELYFRRASRGGGEEMD